MADKKEEEAAPAAIEAPAGPKKIMGLPLPLFGVVVLNAVVMLGGIAYVTYVKLIYTKPPITDTMVVKEIEKRAKSPTDAEPSTKLFTENFSEMTVNLRTSQGGKNHYATVDVSLGCRTEECIPELKAQRAKIEDTIQTAIAAHSYTELNTLEIKARVKYDIEQRLNEFLKDKPVTEIFFSSFIVQ